MARARRGPLARLLAAAALAAALAALRAPLGFAAARGPPAGAEAPGRRAALLSAAWAAAAAAAPPALLGGAGAAWAAKAPPDALEVSGAPSDVKAINGEFTIVQGKQVNERAVYKSVNADYYLLVNDCGSFQIGKSSDGVCDGVAVENKGNWKIQGQSYLGFKVKPVKKKEDAPPPVKTVSVASTPESDAPPSKFATKVEEETDLLNKDVNVGAYIQNKGGDNFLAETMKLDQTEAKTAMSLEERLNRNSQFR